MKTALRSAFPRLSWRRRMSRTEKSVANLRRWIGMEQLEDRRLLAANPLAVQPVTLSDTTDRQEIQLRVDLPDADLGASAMIGFTWSGMDGAVAQGLPTVRDSAGSLIGSQTVGGSETEMGRTGVLSLAQGQYTVELIEATSTGEFQFEVFLPGDIEDADGRVDSDEVMLVTAAAWQSMGVSNHVATQLFRTLGIDTSRDLYDEGADANQDGRISEIDLRAVEANSRIGIVQVELGGDQEGPVVDVGLQNDSGVLNNDRITTDSALVGSITEENSISSIRIAIDGATPQEALETIGGVSDGGQFSVSSANLEAIHGGPLNEGLHSIQVVAEDGAGNVGSSTVEFTLLVDNEAPQVDSIPTQSAQEDSLFQFVVQGFVDDPDEGDVFTLEAVQAGESSLPNWLSFDPATGTFSGTPTNGDVGEVTIELSAVDSQDARTSTQFTVDVANTNDAPESSEIPEQTMREGVAGSIELSSFFSDPDTGDTLTFSAELESGNDLPGWLSLNPETGTLTGSPSNEDVGTLSVRVTAADSQSATASTLLLLRILDANDPPVLIAAISDQTATEDIEFAFDVSTFFADVDVDDQLTYSATLEGGVPLPTWLSIDGSSGVLSGTPENQDVGEINIEVTAADLESVTVSDVFQLTIINANDAPTVTQLDDLTIDEEATLSETVSHAFSDPDVGDQLTFSAELADGGSLPSWIAFNSETAEFSGVPTEANLGEYEIRVTATDAEMESASTTFTLTVANVNDRPELVIEIEDQRAVEEEPFEVDISASFTDPDPGDALTFTATLENGGPLPAWLTISTDGVFRGTPSNDDTVNASIQVTATDSASATVSDTFMLFVLNVNDPPTASEIPDQMAVEDASFSFDVTEFFADVDPTDQLIYLLTAEGGEEIPEWLSFDSEQGLFSGTPGNEDVGTTTLEVTAVDKNLERVSAIFDLAVENVNDEPTLTGDIPDQRVDQGQEFTFDVSTFFEDVDVGDTLTFSATSDGADLPDWLSIDAATGVLAGTPTDSDVGSIPVEVLASDTSDATVSASFAMEVFDVNDAPSIPDQLFTVSPSATDLSIVATIAATDPDSDGPFEFEVLDGDPNQAFSIDATSGVIVVADATQLVQDAEFTLAVQVTDAGAPPMSGTGTVTILVTDNLAPIADPIPDQGIDEDQSLSFDISSFFSDPDSNGELRYSATRQDGSELPAWLGLDSVSGVFSGIPRNQDVGLVQVEVVATDAGGAQASSDFTLTVLNTNDPPSVPSAIDDQIVTEDVSISFDVGAVFEDSDPGDRLTYRVLSADGSEIPSWLSFSEQNGILTGTPTNDDIGDLDLRVTAVDQEGEEVSTDVRFSVINTNDSPIASDDVGFTTGETDSLLITADELLANDEDPDDGDTLTVIAVDPNSALGASVILDGNQLRYDPSLAQKLLALHEGEEAVDAFSYTVQDEGGLTSQATVSVTVTGKDLVRLRLETTDLDGQPVTEISPGEEFLLRGFSEDLSGDINGGVFSIYLDIEFDSSLASANGDIEFGPEYVFAESGTISPGFIDEVGAVGSISPLGPGEFLVFSIPMVAGNSAGELAFVGNEPDAGSIHEITVYTDAVNAVPLPQVDFGRAELTIAAPQAPAFAALTTAIETNSNEVTEETSDTNSMIREASVDQWMETLAMSLPAASSISSHNLKAGGANDLEQTISSIAIGISEDMMVWV